MENLVMFQAFEWYLENDGNYYNNMKSRAKELKEAGFGAIWIPPVYKATGTNDVGYGVYDIYDLGEFDQKGSIRTKYGTKQELLDMIQELHKYGIRVYADVVMNHMAGADRPEKFKAIKVDYNDRNRELGGEIEIEGWTGFDFPGRKDKYSSFKWNFNHFNGIDFNNLTGEKAIYRIIGKNKGWNLGVSHEKGNFDYLMFADIDHAHTDVVEEFKKWSVWFVNETGVDGFRLDALKHIDIPFINKFVKNINAEFGNDFYIFGEYWNGDRGSLVEYLDKTDHKIDLFDVPLHYALNTISNNGEGFDVRTILDTSLVKSNAMEAVSFVDNHDSQPNESLVSWVEPWFKEIAYSIILLRKEGYPCVFYGDYYGLAGKDHQYEGIKEKIDDLLYLRQNYCLGDQDDYFEDQHQIGWIRKGTEENPTKSAVIISTKENAKIRMFVEEESGTEYIDKLQKTDEKVIIDNQGYGEFFTPTVGVSVWVKKEQPRLK
ncbi:MAG: alpha-amylase [Gudongella sp.]|nr:alpha-amylase [Gudongella sp.]